MFELLQMTKFVVAVKLNHFSCLLSFRCWHRLLLRVLVESFQVEMRVESGKNTGRGFAQIHFVVFNKDFKTSFVFTYFVLS